MLNKVESRDGTTVTIYSKKVAIGGLTSTKSGRWYWALLGVIDTGLDDTAASLEFGGVEHDVDSAFEALSRHWTQWVDAAGLSYKTPEPARGRIN